MWARTDLTRMFNKPLYYLVGAFAVAFVPVKLAREADGGRHEFPDGIPLLR